MIRAKVDASSPDSAAIDQARALILAGSVVAIPTDTLYGLAADPFDDVAVGRLAAAKGRRPDHAIPLVAADAFQVARWIGRLPDLGRRLADRFWPGPLTLLLAAPETIAEAVAGGTGKVGVRVPAHAVPRALCAACDRPLTATSANLTGQPPTRDPDDVAASLVDRIDMLLDAGRTAGGPPSTLVDVTGEAPVLVRAGAIAWDAVLDSVR
jgi:L-threonylcarbamoyladenylate synthase